MRAALKNTANDPQCEGDRSDYVARLIDLSGRKKEIVDRVLHALAAEREDTWALDQLFSLAAIFAKEGNEKARKAIYKRYRKKVIRGSAWCGEDAVVAIDGLDGLKHVAAMTGRALEKNPDDWESSLFVDDFQKKNRKIRVYEELEKEAAGNRYIALYLASIRENRWPSKRRRRRPKLDYAAVKEKIGQGVLLPLPPGRVGELGRRDLERLAEDFLGERDAQTQEAYLRVFSLKKFPFDFAPLLAIAREPNSRANRRVALACRSLQFFSAPEIRRFAVEKLSRTNIPFDYLFLLVGNYRKGDGRLLVRITERFTNEDTVHELLYGAVAIFTKNATAECRKPLEILYEKSTCGIHRHEILEILHENDVLSDTILAEMEFDSYADVRKLFRRIKRQTARL